MATLQQRLEEIQRQPGVLEAVITRTPQRMDQFKSQFSAKIDWILDLGNGAGVRQGQELFVDDLEPEKANAIWVGGPPQLLRMNEVITFFDGKITFSDAQAVFTEHWSQEVGKEETVAEFSAAQGRDNCINVSGLFGVDGKRQRRQYILWLGDIESPISVNNTKIEQVV